MPSSETAHYLEEAGKVTNQTNSRGRLLSKATRYLRHNEKARREQEAKRIREMLTPTNIQLSRLGPQSIEQARKHLNTLEEDLETNVAPTDLSGDTRDALYGESKRLEEKIKTGMLTHEEMRRNPVGAVDRHIRWERTNKADILKWKNIQILLNPDSDEQDLCNIEKLRGHSPLPNGASLYMPESQIPGVFGMTAQAKANWPENMPEFGTVNSPMKQAEDREALEGRIRELEQKLNTNADATAARKMKAAESRRLASERMKARWAAKKASESQQGE